MIGINKTRISRIRAKKRHENYLFGSFRVENHYMGRRHKSTHYFSFSAPKNMEVNNLVINTYKINEVKLKLQKAIAEDRENRKRIEAYLEKEYYPILREILNYQPPKNDK